MSRETTFLSSAGKSQAVGKLKHWEIPAQVWLYRKRGGTVADSVFLAELTIWRPVANPQSQPTPNIPKPTNGHFKNDHISLSAAVGSASDSWNRDQLATYHQMKRAPNTIVNPIPPMASAACA